jgi:hypothetical protein
VAYLNKALTGFRIAVNAMWPDRDKTTDGWLGDADHQTRASEHNPDEDGSVDAWDMDTDGPDVALCKRVFQAHESSHLWIHNRQIARRATNWEPEPYDGPNPHDKHVHWQTRPSFESSAAPWILEEDDLDQKQIDQLAAVHWAVTALPGEGDERIPLQVWAGRIRERLDLLEAKIDRALAGGVTAQAIVDDLVARLKG